MSITFTASGVRIEPMGLNNFQVSADVDAWSVADGMQIGDRLHGLGADEIVAHMGAYHVLDGIDDSVIREYLASQRAAA